MASLLNASGLAMRFGALPLFADISLNLEEGDRLGLIGPNGSGKSTLLQLLAGRREPDSGTIALRKNTRLAYVEQASEFQAELSIRDVIEAACERAAVAASDLEARVAENLGKSGFTDFTMEAVSLSGGWKKRLAITEALVANPDLLLLDEPTNHLDLAGIEWLERLLVQARYASIVVSHDRYFLENVATAVAELNRSYSDGLLRVRGNYSNFLEKKGEFLAAREKHQDALANRVRTEMEWLRRGPKARATKAKARIDKAHELISELNDLNTRSQTQKADLDFVATNRKTKRLMETRNLRYQLESRTLFSDVSLVLTAGMRVGLLGPNGSGKTTLLRLLQGELQPQQGEVLRADGLRIVYFEQNRYLDPDLTLRRTLAPHGDSVIYRDQVIHVASWAARFLFTTEQLNQPVSRLSGGERARVLIANLMLQPADVLMLDEPTNDLDIPTLELLEENLLEFGGVLLLVTHDRYLLDRVSTSVWALDGEGGVGQFADYSQWEESQSKKREFAKPIRDTTKQALPAAVTNGKKKLSYLDSRDFATIEERIAKAEDELKRKQANLSDSDVTSNPERLQSVLNEVHSAQEKVDQLYERWAELEAKIG